MNTFVLSRVRKHSLIVSILIILAITASCSTSPSFFGLALFPTGVDFNALQVGMQQDELKESGIIPNESLKRSLGSFDNEAKKMVTRKLETWVFKNSNSTRQYLYFNDKELVGWEEIDLDIINSEDYYSGQWKDWERNYE